MWKLADDWTSVNSFLFRPFDEREKPPVTVLFIPSLLFCYDYIPKLIFEIFFRYAMKASDFGDIISWSRAENCSHGSRNMSFVLGLLSGFL